MEIEEELNNEIFTIELNLNDDPLGMCSWHIDTLDNTMRKNIENAIFNRKTGPWVLVGIAQGYKAASKLLDDIRDHIKQGKALLNE